MVRLKYIKNCKTLINICRCFITRSGGKVGDKIYSCIIPEVLKEVGSVVHFEAENILLAVRCWCKEFKNKTILI